MHTFQDLRGAACAIGSNDQGPQSWPPTTVPKKGLRIADGRGSLRLPETLDRVEACTHIPTSPDRGPAISDLARRLYLASGPLASALKAQDVCEVCVAGISKDGRSSHSRLIANAICLESDDACWFGLGVFYVDPNSHRPGSAHFLLVEELWFDNEIEFCIAWVDLLAERGVIESVSPESSSPPWKRMSMLVGGGDRPDPLRVELPFQLAGGLLAMQVKFHYDADKRYNNLVSELKTAPPSYLGLDIGSVKRAESMRGQLSTNSYCYNVDLSSPTAPHADFLLEVFCNEASLTSDGEVQAAIPLNKEDFAKAVLELESPHFKLSDRSKRRLASISYLDLPKMLRSVSSLERVAEMWSTRETAENIETLGRSMGLRIAMTDSSLEPFLLKIDGKSVSGRAEPHVKVDDSTSLDRCGRIYFAVDKDRKRFIVDHIGVHDYGRSK